MVSNLLRDTIFKRDKFKCQSCGCKEKIFLTVDHIVSRKKGGKDIEDNLETYCFQCNQLKGNTSKEVFAKMKEHFGELRILGVIQVKGAVSISYPQLEVKK